ncbi:MAG: geranylgeranyl reductase family protein [Candidatus Nezhaarchaeota archaeon]|nr:geranylgeranyl reductase family protein [Candidatus Nezhaarchaeota archaeon]
MLDLVVVGCGPAGSSALRRAAELRLRVLGVERLRLPRHKPCAGVLYPRVVEEFEVPREVVVSPLRAIKLVSPSGREAFVSFEEPGAMVDRASFDHWLAKKAAEAGARVLEGAALRALALSEGGCRLRVEGLGLVESKFVVAADGVYSTVARSLGLTWRRPCLALALQAYVESSAHAEEGVFEVRYDPGRLPGGWWWAAWRRGPSIVGAGQLVELMGRAEGLRAKLRGLVAELRARPMAEEAYMIPLRGPRRLEELVVKDRVVFAGDAGGFVRSDTGEGVYYAMHSGEAAAEAVAEALEGAELKEAFQGRLEERGLLQLYEATELHEALRSPEEAEAFVARVARASRAFTPASFSLERPRSRGER